MSRFALIRPLRERDFRLLWAGMTISLLGDGVFLVATAWQVYDLSGSPASLSLVGLSWSLGFVACLLLGGVVADRTDRRRVMIAADAVRGLCVGTMGVLAVTGAVQIWHLAALGLLYGCAEGFFTPSFSSLVPQIVPRPVLVQANSLQQVARPLAEQLAGPALGGVLVGAFDAGVAYLVDAASFVVAIGCVTAIAPRALPERDVHARVRDELREGWGFVRTQPWLWATIIAALVSVLCFVGPLEVLLPYVVREDLDAGAGAYGAILAVAGVGQVIAGVVVAQLGLPRKALRLMYVTWGAATLPIAGYAFGTAVWQLAAMALVFGVCMAVGEVVWGTLMQTRVPPQLMGRVTSLDWMVSLALTPVSFALCGPASALIGVDATLVAAGLLPAAAMLVIWLAVPRLRSDVYEGGDVVGEAGVAHVGGIHPDDLDPVPGR